MKRGALLAALGLAAAAGLVLAHTGPQPSRVTGLVPGGWFVVTVRSSLNVHTFGADAARQQAQALLGAQRFDVRASAPDAVDPFVYHVAGIYRGTSGALVGVPGLTMIAAAPSPPVASTIGLDYEDARPVPLAAGVTYYGRASIGWPLSMIVTRAAVAGELAATGFSGVEVFLSPAELPATWPASERGGDVFARATYAGAPKAMDLPGQVVSVWREASA